MTRVGTVRRSPDGVVAVYRGPQPFGGDWGTSVEVDGFFDISDPMVALWQEVYTPPPPPRPVGTVMRRPGGGGHWQVAVRKSDANNGWTVVSSLKIYHAQALDEHTSDWEVLYGPVVGARPS